MEEFSRPFFILMSYPFIKPENVEIVIRDSGVRKYDQPLETVDIPGIEVFMTGMWNGDRYEVKDLQGMVEALGKTGFKPPVKAIAKAGHAGGQEDEKKARAVFGAPALGYVKQLYLSGKKLLADLERVPKKFAELIKAGAYERISAEIYWDYKDERNGAVLPRVLKAVSFLGADIPALTSLDVIRSLYEVADNGHLYDENKNEFRVYDMENGKSDSWLKDTLEKILAYVRPKDYAMTIKEEGEGKFCVYKDGEKIKTFPTRAEAEAYIRDQGEKLGAYDDGGDLRQYVIEKRGEKWCLLSHSGKVLGCHDSKQGALDQEKAIKANMEKSMTADAVTLTVEDMEGICPPCAESMRKKNFRAVKIHYAYDGEKYYLDLPEGTISSLCEKFGESEGFRTKCMPWAEDKVNDPGAFCNALKQECFEASQRTKRHSQGGEDMDEKEKQKLEAEKKELEAKLAAQAEELKKFQAKDEEKGKAEAEEKKRMQERIDELERKGKADTIAARLERLRMSGKVAPVEIPRLKAIFSELPEKGLVVAYTKDDKTEAKEPIAETIWGFIEGRPSLFKTLSKTEREEEKESFDYETENAGEEMDKRVKAYIEKNQKAKYSDAMKAVAREDPQLADAYNRQQKH